MSEEQSKAPSPKGRRPDDLLNNRKVVELLAHLVYEAEKRSERMEILRR